MMDSILVIDDNETDRYFAQRFMTRDGYEGEFYTAIDGLDALELLESSKVLPQVILVDVNMPRMGGFEFLDKFAELREAREELASIVVVMYSSSDHKEDIDRSSTYGFVKDFIVKPLSKESLDKLYSLSTTSKCMKNVK